MPWRQTPSQKKKAVMFTNVTMNAYQGQLNTGFSKVCEIFKVCGIESSKYIREFVIVATFPCPEMWCWMKQTVICCLTCRSNGLMGGPWPMNAAIYSRPSAISLKVWLRRIRLPKNSAGKNIWACAALCVRVCMCMCVLSNKTPANDLLSAWARYRANDPALLSQTLQILLIQHSR